MIAAVQLLSKNPNPTVAQIKDAFTNTPPSAHLCRCGTYTAIIDAVQRAAREGGASMAVMSPTVSNMKSGPCAISASACV